MGAFSGPRPWGRFLTAMITPFDAEGRVDHEAVARVAVHLVDSERNEGLVVSGTTGESPTLSPDEKLAVLETTLAAVSDRASVVFGAGTYDTAESVRLAREAERRGAHGVMAVNPYYSRPGQAGLEAHFRAIAEAVSLPVMLYNIQGRSAINLETPTLLRLAEVPNIVSVKEASGNLGQISEVAASVPEGFLVYSGDDGLTLPILALGGHGVVSVAGHVAGREIRTLVDTFATDPAGALSVHRRLAPLFRILFEAPSPTPVKAAVARQGLCRPDVRLPLVLPEPAFLERLDAVVGALRA